MADHNRQTGDKAKGDEQYYFPPPPPGPPPVAQTQYPPQTEQFQQGQYPQHIEDPQQTQYPPKTEYPQQGQYTHDAAYNPPAGPPPIQQQPVYGAQTTSQAQPQFPPPPQHPNDKPIPDYNPADYHPAGHAYNAPPVEPQAQLSDEEKRHSKHKGWSTKMHQLGAKAAGPINAFANKMGSQAFLPSTMDKECEKAAAILLSFCSEFTNKRSRLGKREMRLTPHFLEEGAHGDGQRPVTPVDGAKSDAKRSRSRDRALVRIPRKVLTNAVGLAIFTTARIGFQFSAATGSGVLIARLPDGSWSPPSGIQVHTLGAGFLAGVDIYDCVCVINSPAALEAFMRTRVSLGSEIGVSAGPFGAGGKLDIGAGAGPYEPAEQGHSSYGKEKPAGQVPASTQPPPAVVEPTQSQTQPGVAAPGVPTDPTKLSAEGQQRPTSQHRRSSSLKSLSPVFTYIKSRGLWAGIQADGTVITERKEANHAFYGQAVSVQQILRSEGLVAQEAATLWPKATTVLLDALKKAEMRKEDGEEVIVPPAVVTPAVAHPPPAAGAYGAAGPSTGAPVQPEHAGYYKADEAVASGAIRNEELPPYQAPAAAYPGSGDQKGPNMYQ
ncbi:hypothetical protein jhhlp_008126 [Lomentospora prolificans]|uniref:Ysc84 actin-binding domain-containing protein n=1 Tax=Lomentospora prolificans TaxID=41688 RepID=A0A2N3MZK5_9PEZI|nr:hypothetical protein jhhlp_008126 [Lomentospora prolificans]